MTAEEFIENHKTLSIDQVIEWDGEDQWFVNNPVIFILMIQFAQYHVKQALKAASEKAVIATEEGYEGFFKIVDKHSILSAYPKELIT